LAVRGALALLVAVVRTVVVALPLLVVVKAGALPRR
jgi:hypothetical protein